MAQKENGGIEMPESAFVDLKVNSATNGSVYFASDVICTIAGLALAEIDGVDSAVRLNAQRNDKNSKKNAINIRSLTKGIKADVKDGNVSLSITTVIEYGYAVPEVSRSIQENVKKTVETMTGMTVQNVDVHVTGLNFDKEDTLPEGTSYHNYISGNSAKAIAEKEANGNQGE